MVETIVLAVVVSLVVVSLVADYFYFKANREALEAHEVLPNASLESLVAPLWVIGPRTIGVTNALKE
jgi:hypothetical protein